MNFTYAISRSSLRCLASLITLRRDLRLLILLLILASCTHARAVEVVVSGSTGFNTGDPTSSQIADWDTGWGASNVTGWNYVGTVNGGSAVYLGNNWVITAGHIGAGTFSLDGTSYNMVAGSAEGITNSSLTADLTLFQLVQGPSLPSLTLATSTPTAYSTQVAMIGYGGGEGETWGLNTVTEVNDLIGLQGYYTTDFETDYGNFYPTGEPEVTNTAFFVGGDSGGGDFTFDPSTGSWMLAGINEAVEDNDSYMVQLNTYSPQIDQVIGVPEPPCTLPAGLMFAVLLIGRWRSKKWLHIRCHMF